MPPQPDATAPDPAAKVGVLLYSHSAEVAAVISAAVARLRARGIKVGGLLQRSSERSANGRSPMWVDDITTGESVRLDNPRGSGASGCVLDPDALAKAACMLRRITEGRPEVIVVNRFGHAEAEGGGMRPEIADAVLSGAAVLIAVRFSLLHAMEDFLGSTPTILLPSDAAVADWAEYAAALGHPEGTACA